MLKGTDIIRIIIGSDQEKRAYFRKKGFNPLKILLKTGRFQYFGKQ